MLVWWLPARATLRRITPYPVRKFIRTLRKAIAGRNGAMPAELAVYEAVSRIGLGSSNKWIARSAGIGGWLLEGEPEYLWELATRSQDGDILEVGSWMGKSACIFAGACKERAPGTRVICIDPFDMRGTPDQKDKYRTLFPGQPGTFYDFIANAKRLGFFEYIIPVATTSEKALPYLSSKFRLVFLDGSHDYRSISREVTLALPKLKSGGLLVLHDANNSGWPDIDRYVADTLMKSTVLRFYGNRRSVVAFEKK